jgi:hypothetical protein
MLYLAFWAFLALKTKLTHNAKRRKPRPTRNYKRRN